ncbi:hypothetical protein ASZ90_008767 [hydrocarbon metagenome]|uniref:Uncharacterized protein n=1 Tax=hydrocarbon metagenome TaxID=938273 RepID=A0A0W8FL83_9ZZZZ
MVVVLPFLSAMLARSLPLYVRVVALLFLSLSKLSKPEVLNS